MTVAEARATGDASPIALSQLASGIKAALLSVLVVVVVLDGGGRPVVEDRAGGMRISVLARRTSPLI